MQKGTLQSNILKKAKQRFIVSGLPDAIVLTRATFVSEIGIIKLPDGTNVAGIDTGGSDFTITIQFGDDIARNTYLSWFDQAVDKQGRDGISPDYKRDAEIVFLRSHRRRNRLGRSLSNNEETNQVIAYLSGVWCQKYVIPDADVDAVDGDGFSTMECTLSYDGVELDFS